MTHLVSIISQGLLERHRNLKVFAVGGGALWLPGWIWRVESDYSALGSSLPWIKRRPLDQLLEQIRVSTYSFRSAPAAKALAPVLQAIDGLEEVLCFGSGYPRWDADDLEVVAGRLPSGWLTKVAFENAARLFRWPKPAPATA
jgi:predicted TIM-barrel fold metal-dependent hydrolase